MTTIGLIAGSLVLLATGAALGAWAALAGLFRTPALLGAIGRRRAAPAAAHEGGAPEGGWMPHRGAGWTPPPTPYFERPNDPRPPSRTG